MFSEKQINTISRYVRFYDSYSETDEQGNYFIRGRFKWNRRKLKGAIKFKPRGNGFYDVSLQFKCEYYDRINPSDLKKDTFNIYPQGVNINLYKEKFTYLYLRVVTNMDAAKKAEERNKERKAFGENFRSMMEDSGNKEEEGG